MTAPTFSIVVPTYNYGHFLPVCIESVLAQSFADWELIISDDQSSDDTQAIATSYRDNRIRYIRNRRRLGMYPNFASGVAQSSGRIIKPLPADDFMLPDCLQTFNTVFGNHSEVVLATCGVKVCDVDGRFLSTTCLPGAGRVLEVDEVAEFVSRQGCIFGGNSMYAFRRSAYDQVGGYPLKILYSGDFALAVQLCRVGSYFAIVEPLVAGRLHGSQSGVRDTRGTVHIEDRFRIYDLMFAPHSNASALSILHKAARRRETGLYAFIALKALLSKKKRSWSVQVLRVLKNEVGTSNVFWAAICEFPTVIRHYLRTRSGTAMVLRRARRTIAAELPHLEPDPSIEHRTQ